MCGLFSIISKKKSGFSEKDLKIFTEGLFSDTLRGKDSTGVFSISKEGNAYLLKDNSPGDIFINSPEYKDFIDKSYHHSLALVGHNRAATLGQKTDKNAHPFISGDTVCVHNGTIYNHLALANTETDSEAITINLNTRKHTDVLEDINGAFALIWYNAKEKKIYAARNKERPLWILETDSFDMLGSEPKLLEWILNRNSNLDINAKYLQTEHIYVWDLNFLNQGYLDVIAYEKKKIPIQNTKKHTAIISTSLIKNQNCEVYPNVFLYKPIIVTPIKTEIIEQKTIVYGTNPNCPLITFKATIFNKKEDEIKKILNQDKLIFRPYTKSNLQNEVICVIDELSLIITDISKNKHVIDNNTKCNKCQSKITKEDDNKIWIRKRQLNIKTILCPECVTNNPNLKS